MEVLVVGGVKSFVLGPVQKHLKAEGVNIAWFVSEKDNLARTYTGIPAGCEGVIVMRDGISHSLSGKVNNDAKAAGVRIAMVDRQWSRSEGLLRKHGFLPPAPVATTPSLTVAPPPPPSLPKQLAPSWSWETIANALAEDYGQLLDVPTFVARIAAESKGNAGDKNLVGTVNNVIKDKQAKWAKSYALRVADIRHWLTGRFKQFRDTGKGWVGFNDPVMQSIFGRKVQWDEVAYDARAEAFGEWARTLISLSPAIEEFTKLRPNVPFDPAAEIIAGRLQGVAVPLPLSKTGNLRSARYYTSKVAVQDFADTYHPLPTLAIVTPSPAPAAATPPVTVAPPPQAPAPVVPKPADTSLDWVGMADLIETGVNSKVETARTSIEAKANATQASVQELRGEVAALTALVKDMAIHTTLLLASMKDLLADQTALIAHVKAHPPTHPLVQAIQDAKGAEVRLIIGEMK